MTYREFMQNLYSACSYAVARKTLVTLSPLLKPTFALIQNVMCCTILRILPKSEEVWHISGGDLSIVDFTLVFIHIPADILNTLQANHNKFAENYTFR